MATRAEISKCKKLLGQNREGKPTYTYYRDLENPKKKSRECRSCKIREDIAKSITGEGLKDGLCLGCRTLKKPKINSLYSKSESYSPFNKKETLERYKIALKQLKQYPYDPALTEEVVRYGKNLGYTETRIYNDLDSVRETKR